MLLRLGRRPALAGTVLALAASAVAAAALYRHGLGDNRVYFGTDTQAQALLAGAVAAQLLHAGRLDRLLRRRRGPLVATAAGLVLGGLAVLLSHGDSWRAHGGFVVIELAAAVVVVTLAGRRGVGERLLTWEPLAYLGRRSYAVYLWSYVLATWFHSLGAWQLPLTVAASLGAAEASWRVVERPALRLKRRLEPGGADGATEPGGADGERQQPAARDNVLSRAAP